MSNFKKDKKKRKLKIEDNGIEDKLNLDSEIIDIDGSEDKFIKKKHKRVEFVNINKNVNRCKKSDNTNNNLTQFDDNFIEEDENDDLNINLLKYNFTDQDKNFENIDNDMSEQFQSNKVVDNFKFNSLVNNRNNIEKNTNNKVFSKAPRLFPCYLPPGKQ
jgi:hypothetical protein